MINASVELSTGMDSSIPDPSSSNRHVQNFRVQRERVGVHHFSARQSSPRITSHSQQRKKWIRAARLNLLLFLDEILTSGLSHNVYVGRRFTDPGKNTIVIR